MSANNAVGGSVYLIQNGAGGVPVVIAQDPFVLSELPDMGSGKPNTGFSYGVAIDHQGSGIQIGRGRIEPGGMSAAHATPDQYILYVVGGTGSLVLFDSNDVQTGTVAYKPEDVIVFQPNVVHAWQNDSTSPLDFVGVDLPPPRA